MNAQQLKNAILQEAITGRLVPQDPNDEPASVLLDRIRKEKAKLVKEKKIILSKPEKACKIKDEGQFQIPNNWKWAMINDVCRVFGRIGFRGYTKSDLRNTREKAAISISPSNMVNGTMDFTHCTYISEEKYEESPEIKIQNDDILIVKTGSSYGKTSLVENLPWKSTINPQIAVIKEIAIDKKFLLFFMQSPYAQSNFKEFVLGTSIPTFSQLNLISMQIPLPPLSEQHRIVAKIEELLPKVEEYGKAQEALDKLNAELPERLKKSILQEAITGKLVPQDPNDEPASVLLDRIRKEKAKLVKEGKLKKKDLIETPISKEEIPFEIPESWEWCRLISLSRIIHYGYTASAAPTGNAKLLRITDIQDDKVNWQTVPFCTIKEKDLDNYQLHNRDILIARTGGTVGKTYIVRELNDVSVFASYLIRAIPLGNVYEEYIKLFMGSPYYWSQLIDATSGTGQPNVNGQSLSNLIVPLPPLSEQRRIVAKIEELLSKIDKLKTK